MLRVPSDPSSPKELVASPPEEVQKTLQHAELFVSQVKGYLNDPLADADGAEGTESGV
jgi:hypothetical protein